VSRAPTRPSSSSRVEQFLQRFALLIAIVFVLIVQANVVDDELVHSSADDTEIRAQ
jgi:hypothetical protein